MHWRAAKANRTSHTARGGLKTMGILTNSLGSSSYEPSSRGRKLRMKRHPLATTLELLVPTALHRQHSSLHPTEGKAVHHHILYNPSFPVPRILTRSSSASPFLLFLPCLAISTPKNYGTVVLGWLT